MVGQNCWMTKSQQIYPTDLNDTQWLKIRPYLPAKAQTGRPREHGWRMILNSQSTKTSEGGSECGFDAGKKVTGRKRHTLVDTLGLILKVMVTAGNVQDRDGAKSLLEEISTEKDVAKRLNLIWADGGYRGELISWVEETLG